MSTHVKFWLAVLLVVFLATPFLTSEERLRNIATHELSMMHGALGLEATNSIVKSANGIYSSLFLKTGFVAKLRDGETADEDRAQAGKTLGSSMYSFTTVANSYLLAGITLLYLAVLRASMVIEWIPFLLPFLIAAVVDGVVRHKVTHSSVMVSNPVKFKLASHAVVLCAVTPALYLVAPMAITPYFVLIWAVFFAVAMMMLLAEMAPFTYK